jgi:hypothetical protein
MNSVAKQPIAKARTIIEHAPAEERTRDTPQKKRRTTASVSVVMGLAYEWLLELPVPVVLVVMWISGVALLGAGALLAYAVIYVLVGMVTGPF